MSEARFDTGPVGRVRSGIVAMITGGIVVLTVTHLSPSGADLAVGLGFGALLFVLRRLLLDSKRFQRGWMNRHPGALTIATVALAIAYFALDRFEPDATPFTLAHDFSWACLAVALAFCFEAIDGFLFYTRRDSIEQRQRLSKYMAEPHKK